MDYPVIIPPIHFKKLKQSKIWGQKGLVRANMQGICGNICTLEEYEEFKKLIQKENSAFDISMLPNPPKYSQYGRTDLVLERDIEEKLLEPLLTNLGYSVKTDFKRQYPIRMGRGIRYYLFYEKVIIFLIFQLFEDFQDFPKKNNYFRDFLLKIGYLQKTTKSLQD